MRGRIASVVLFGGALAAGCGGGAADEDEEPVGTVSESLSPTDSVASAVTQACSTTAVKGLATQLVDEIQCMRPGTMKSIAAVPGLSLGAAVFPYLQAPAANALSAARAARGSTMTINSALRTLPQQYLLYRWYRTGRCGIGLAASPGRSNHESGVAVDINDAPGWRATMSSKAFRWLGASDPVHFDYVGAGGVDLRGYSVKAFQRLWNRNHPTDRIAEDGAYGPATEARLARAPVGGFAIGAQCNKTQEPDGDTTAPQATPPDAAPVDVPIEPDAPEPEVTAPSGASPASGDAPANGGGGSAVSAASGCAVRGGTERRAGVEALALLGVGLAVARRRRYRVR
jgi:MYXO-CTERM domain-containing protein